MVEEFTEIITSTKTKVRISFKDYGNFLESLIFSTIKYIFLLFD